ncbi:hypothetical protein [Haliangium ochraceum]|uniref:Uncharacterized protein n=1 Tax=Haliangium ochraceum (strain DSM 14365 / JCM 11303 / SMP-2) TaxID=502025 RepID=D0LM60_HALO1|nr:hypothetical protein [Haliangium ochraceum]ACY16766.1 hypothetical protein Hoch_4269 [Haliangium ochraceum DSM 14365]
MHKRMVLALAALVGLSINLAWQGRAEAGCICPDITQVRTGDLRVTGARVVSQAWTVTSSSASVRLQLAELSTATRIEVMAAGVPAEEADGFLALAKANYTDGDDVRQRAKAPAGFALRAEVSSVKGSAFRERKLAWRVTEAAGSEASFTLSWQFPAAGADELPLERKSFIAAFCIDKGTKRAIRKRADGHLRVDFVLSSDMRTGMSLRIERDSLPISLCANKVVKRGRNAFEIRGRDNLEDKNGVLPILFSASI